MATVRDGLSSKPSLRPQMPKMAELVAALIRNDILSGKYLPGESLSPESDLIERYDVSRPTLREALRLLEAQQLVTVRRGSHSGPTARLPDASVTASSFAMLLQLRNGTTADIYQFRMIFEPVAARMAADRATQEELSSLRSLLDAEFKLQDDFSAFTVVAWRFHSEMVGLSGNRAMALVAETFEHISQRHAAVYMSNIENSQKQSQLAYKAHKRLVDLLEQRRGADAEKFWLRHMKITGDKFLANVEHLPVIELLD